MNAGPIEPFEYARIEIRRGGRTHVVELEATDAVPLTGSLELNVESHELSMEETDFAPYRIREATGVVTVQLHLRGKLGGGDR